MLILYFTNNLPNFTQVKQSLAENCYISLSEYSCLFFSSKLTFKSPNKEDLGSYSVVVTDTDGVSASHTLSEEGE